MAPIIVFMTPFSNPILHHLAFLDDFEYPAPFRWACRAEIPIKRVPGEPLRRLGRIMP